MDVEVINVEPAQSDWECRYGMEITIDGKSVFSVSDGEPEDSNLSRNFDNCYNISNLMKMAYDAGKKGEDWSIEQKTITWDQW